MPAARPFGTHEYKPEYIDKLYKYIEECRDKITTFHKTVGDKSDSYERIIEVKLPTIEGFAIYLGFARKTIYNWEKQFPDFAEALDSIRTEQMQRLINSGLSGDYNHVIAKLLLSNNHGMRERKDVTTGDKPLPLFDYASRHNDSDPSDSESN